MAKNKRMLAFILAFTMVIGLFVSTAPFTAAAAVAAGETGLAPGDYHFSDGKYWNDWTTVTDVENVGTFGAHENEIQQAVNSDGVGMTRIWVGSHNDQFTNNSDIYPWGPIRLYIGVENLGDTDYDNTVFGNRLGALTYKSDYPISDWQVGGNNPKVDVPGEVPEGDQSYLGTGALVILSKGPLDYTQPVEGQLADGYGEIVATSYFTVHELSGSVDPAKGYTYLTIAGLEAGSMWGGDDWVQPAFVDITVAVQGGSGSGGVTGETANIPAHAPVYATYSGLQFDSNGLLKASAYYQVQTFETGKEPDRAIYVGLDGNDSYPGTFDKPLRNIAKALVYAKPGDSILLKPGTYSGLRITDNNLNGTADKPIWIGGIPGMERPVLDGNNAGASFVDCTYIVLHDLEVRNNMTDPEATGIQVYASDTSQWPNPLVRDFVFRNLYVHDINYQQFKFSDLTDFWLFDCEISKDGNGQSAPIDSVGGVGRGVIAYNYLHDFVNIGIQLKGNTFDVDIYGNLFKNTGQQAINIGGSTGRQFFRPSILDDDVAAANMYEASNIHVYSNIFTNVNAPVAFWSSDNSYFVNNTVTGIKSQTFRLLPSDTYLAFGGQSHNNTIENNIFSAGGFYFNTETCPDGTAALTVDNNFFYNTSSPGSVPGDAGFKSYTGNVGGNAQFMDLTSYKLKDGSPAATGGTDYSFAPSDYYGRPFAADRSYGAAQYIEGDTGGTEQPGGPSENDGWDGDRKSDTITLESRYNYSGFPADKVVDWGDGSLSSFDGSVFGDLTPTVNTADISGYEVSRVMLGGAWYNEYDGRVFMTNTAGLPTSIGGGAYVSAVTYKLPHPIKSFVLNTGWNIGDAFYGVIHKYPLDYTKGVNADPVTHNISVSAPSDDCYYLTIFSIQRTDDAYTFWKLDATMAVPDKPYDDVPGVRKTFDIEFLAYPDWRDNWNLLDTSGWDAGDWANYGVVGGDYTELRTIKPEVFDDFGVSMLLVSGKQDSLAWAQTGNSIWMTTQDGDDYNAIPGSVETFMSFKVDYPIVSWETTAFAPYAFGSVSQGPRDFTSIEAYDAGAYGSPIRLTDTDFADYSRVVTKSGNIDPAAGCDYLTIAHTGWYGLIDKVSITVLMPEEPAGPDKTALNKLISDVSALDENDYTADSWAGIAEPLAAAIQVAGDDNATQDQIDAAYAALLAAKNALVEKDRPLSGLSVMPPKPDNFNGVELDENGRLDSESYYEVNTFETGKEPTREVFVDPANGSDYNPGTLEQPYQSCNKAFQNVTPGTAIYLLPGTYTDTIYTAGFYGTADKPIWFGGVPGMAKPVFDGAMISFIGGAYMVIHDIEIENVYAGDGTGTGINIHDGGDIYDYPDYVHDFVLRNLYVHDIQYQQIKFARLNRYWVFDCDIRTDENGQCGGIDAAGGCSDGVIAYNYISDMQGMAIQIKGNSCNVDVYGNLLHNAGIGINIGQATDPQFYAPPLDQTPANMKYEARNVHVYSNVIIGGRTPGMFSCATDCSFVNNTVILPEAFLFRILNMHPEPGLLTNDGACSNCSVINNIYYYYFDTSSDVFFEPFNTGGGNMADTFTIENNVFYNLAEPGVLPPKDQWGVYEERFPNIVDSLLDDVKFKDESAMEYAAEIYCGYYEDDIALRQERTALIDYKDVELTADSPYTSGGEVIDYVTTDFTGKPFADSRSLGALQYEGTIENPKDPYVPAGPNPYDDPNFLGYVPNVSAPVEVNAEWKTIYNDALKVDVDDAGSLWMAWSGTDLYVYGQFDYPYADVWKATLDNDTVNSWDGTEVEFLLDCAYNDAASSFKIGQFRNNISLDYNSVDFKYGEYDFMPEVTGDEAAQYADFAQRVEDGVYYVEYKIDLAALTGAEAPDGSKIAGFTADDIKEGLKLGVNVNYQVADEDGNIAANYIMTSPVWNSHFMNVILGGESPSAGESVISTVYTGKGAVSGDGTYSNGTDATVSAVPSVGYVFTGWFEDGTCVSTDADYTFTVTADRTLEARFAVDTALQAKYDVNGDGKVDASDLALIMANLNKKASASAIAKKCDVDGNGMVDMADYAAVVAYIAAMA